MTLWCYYDARYMKPANVLTEGLYDIPLFDASRNSLAAVVATFRRHLGNF